MKMTKYILLTCAALLTLSSCEKWLDVSPKTQVKSDNLFKSEEGFRDALYGIYTVMARTAAYGGEFGMAAMDAFAQCYNKVDETYSNLMNLNYEQEGSKTRIDGMWSTAYYAIANCNNLLMNIDNKKDIFSAGTYEITKAEAIAARAYLHLDLLRAFGPVPTPANLDKPAIPVMLNLTAVPSELSTVNEVLDFVLTQVAAARELIAPFDPLGPNSGFYVEEDYGDYSTPGIDQYSDGGFRMYRRSRLNYYGMTALMARAALWGGRTQEAAKYAREVIDSRQFTMMTEEEYNTQAFLMKWISMNEYVSSLYKNKMQTEVADRYFLRDQGTNASWRSAALCYTEDGLVDLFGNDRDFDWRYKKQIAQNAYGDFVPVKYESGNRIPLVKISEMYLIVAEIEQSVAMLNELRDHRGFENNRLDPATVDFRTVLTNEYRREFFAEGQLFYYYKRNNFASFHNGKEANEKVYVLPQPDNEIEFGNGYADDEN